MLRFTLFTLLASGVFLSAQEDPKKITPKFKLSKETTYVLEPLDQEGYIDYEAALNRQLKGKSTPESNAIVLLLQAFGPKPERMELRPEFYQWLGVKAPPEKGDYLVEYSKYFEPQIRGNNNVQAFYDLETRLRRRPWNAEESPIHADWLKLNEKPLALAIEASKRRDYFHPIISRGEDGKPGMLVGALLPMVQRTREIATALSLRATLKLADGKVEDVLEDVLAMHRLGRLISRGGSLIELLVGIAIQAIAHQSEITIFEYGELTAKQALAYQAELLKLPEMAKVADKISLFDRLTFLDAVQSMPRSRGGEDVLGMPELTELNRAEVRDSIDIELIFRLGNRWFDKMETALRKPNRAERLKACAELAKEHQKREMDGKNLKLLPKDQLEKRKAEVSEQIGNAYLYLLNPAIEKISDASDRSEQMQRNGLILTALAAYFADNKQYPKKLSDLAPKYLAKVPLDLFSEDELIYARWDDGYLLYSVGVNGKDDGGKLLSDEPRGDDIGIRIPRK